MSLYGALHQTRAYAPATLALHTALWRGVERDLGPRAIGSLSPALVDRVLRSIDAPAMREKTRQLLSAMLNLAVDRGWVGSNAARRRSAPTTRAERKETGRRSATKRYLSPAELARLLAELPARYRPLVHLMARVGLRPGEAYALRVGKLDPLKRTLLIDTAASGDTKTGQARTVVLPTVIVEELVKHIGHDWQPDALIFPGERGQMLDAGNFRSRVFKPAALRAGLGAELRVNDLRHSAVSFAVAHGANVYAVQRMLGHAKPSITLDVYGELWDDSQNKLADQLDAAIRAEVAAPRAPLAVASIAGR
jgi:integrase